MQEGNVETEDANKNNAEQRNCPADESCQSVLFQPIFRYAPK